MLLQVCAIGQYHVRVYLYMTCNIDIHMAITFLSGDETTKYGARFHTPFQFPSFIPGFIPVPSNCGFIPPNICCFIPGFIPRCYLSKQELYGHICYRDRDSERDRDRLAQPAQPAEPPKLSCGTVSYLASYRLHTRLHTLAFHSLPCPFAARCSNQ